MALKDVLKYLKGTAKSGLCYFNHSNAKLKAWSEAGWAWDKKRDDSDLEVC